VVVVVAVALSLVVVLIGLAKWFYNCRGASKESSRALAPRF
jgi:hypothetical protein